MVATSGGPPGSLRGASREPPGRCVRREPVSLSEDPKRRRELWKQLVTSSQSFRPSGPPCAVLWATLNPRAPPKLCERCWKEALQQLVQSGWVGSMPGLLDRCQSRACKSSHRADPNSPGARPQGRSYIRHEHRQATTSGTQTPASGGTPLPDPPSRRAHSLIARQPRDTLKDYFWLYEVGTMASTCARLDCPLVAPRARGRFAAWKPAGSRCPTGRTRLRGEPKHVRVSSESSKNTGRTEAQPQSCDLSAGAGGGRQICAGSHGGGNSSDAGARGRRRAGHAPQQNRESDRVHRRSRTPQEVTQKGPGAGGGTVPASGGRSVASREVRPVHACASRARNFANFGRQLERE